MGSVHYGLRALIVMFFHMENGFSTTHQDNTWLRQPKHHKRWQLGQIMNHVSIPNGRRHVCDCSVKCHLGCLLDHLHLGGVGPGLFHLGVWNPARPSDHTSLEGDQLGFPHLVSHHWLSHQLHLSLKSLIIKMFTNGKSIAILVNSYRKKAFWSNGSSYPGYREYTIDKLLEALEIILFNTYIQFNGTVFKQILGIPMGGNASPFIADLYLSWCEYCYVTKLTKTDYNLARRLSYNCRYLDDICTVNLKDFDTISKDIYDNTLILEGSTCSYKRDNFLDLYIRVIDGKFVTGIYHKVDDFNFEVISYPFPDSNIHSSLGYSTFYSQLIRFHRLCNNNKSDFLFRAKLICQKLINRGYKFNLLRKSFMRFTNKYPVEIKYGIQRHDNLFL